VSRPRARLAVGDGAVVCSRLDTPLKDLFMPHKLSASPSIFPAYAGQLSTTPVPALRLPDEDMEPAAAYRFIHDELMRDGSSRLNLATFVTTWMDPEAEKLMAETFDKNIIDKDEHPAAAAIESRCVCMAADLFHAEGLRDDDPATATGVSTIGSSKAVRLAGRALKWRRQRVGDNPKAGWRTRTPNLVMGSNVQVVWEKVLRLLRRRVPLSSGGERPLRHHARASGQRGRRGHHRRGRDPGHHLQRRTEPIAKVCAALDNPRRRRRRGTSRCTSPRPSAASWCRSCTPTWCGTSGCRGRDQCQRQQIRAHLPRYRIRGLAQPPTPAGDLVFRGNYLGGEMPILTLNYSRPGSQVIGQYYDFLRLGRAGYTQVMGCLSSKARWLAGELRKGKHFEAISDGSAIPVICIRLAGDFGYTEFDVFHAPRSYGWQLPAYTMPADATHVTVLRVVVREGFSADWAGLCGRHGVGAGQSGRPQTRRPFQP
jgi:glutamate decarboxylase